MSCSGIGHFLVLLLFCLHFVLLRIDAKFLKCEVVSVFLRGNLNLTLLPSSNLRITFVGDDGRTQRVATLCDISECSVEFKEIPADQSGRSFLVKVPGGETFYFWCSEKSQLLGSELLSKV